MYKVVIFDIDGTLLDATEGILSSVNKTINYLKLKKLSKKEMLDFVGPPIQNSYKAIYENNDIKAQEFANIFRKEYAGGDVYKANAYDGIEELLSLLKNNGYKLGVATYKRQDYANGLIIHFGFDKYIDLICGSDNENKLKKSDILRICINGLTTNKSEVIFIGDSYHDAEAANNLGIDFIGVTYGFGFKTKYEIQKYNPVLCADNIEEIIKYFKFVNAL